jgi:surface antigen
MIAIGTTETGKRLRSAAVVLALLTLAPLPSLAEGLINPFSSAGTGLAEGDSELMKGAIKSVLDAKKAGATADWKSPSGRAGRAISLETYEKNGMACASVQHVFTAGGGSPYTLPFCLTADGTWKVAF